MSCQYNVCFVPGEYPPIVGGLSKSAFRVASFLADAQYQVHVITPIHHATKSEFANSKIKVHHVNIEGLNTIEAAKSLALKISELDKIYNFAIFHGFHMPMSYPCTFRSMVGRRPLITSIRGSDAINSIKKSQINITKLILKNTTCLTTVNASLLQKVTDKIKYEGRSIQIKNSIAPPETIWDINHCTKNKIGTVGKFQKCKEIPTLLSAFNALNSTNQYSLNLIGDFTDDSTRNEAESVIGKTKHTNSISITGIIDYSIVKKEIVKLNVFVSTSSHEGFPNAILEAASMGVPIVTTNFPGVEEYLENKKNAIIVPIGEKARLNLAIEEVCSNPQLAQTLSTNGRKLATELNLENEKKQWLEMYSSLLNDTYTNIAI